jgi:dihydroorotate dehydrogenase electron transfer subunit
MKTASEDRSIVVGEVIANPGVAPGHFLLTLGLPPLFATPQPGQFVMIRDPERGEPLLPRPLSVYGFHREEGRAILELLYRVAGRGTSLLSRMKSGAAMTVLGPLGQGFSLPCDVQKAILLAGGVGVAPLTYLLHAGYVQNVSLHKIPVTAYVGARTAELIAGMDRLKGFCDLRIATDDGSAGYHGLGTDYLRSELGGCVPRATMLYACGPAAMIRSLGFIARESAFRCEVSLEERMACGIGACLGCAVAVKDGQGGRAYRRVCHDGPVFNLHEIAFLP